MNAVSSRSWKSLLENNDVATLWKSLHRLVAIHPLVRSAQRNQNSAKESIPLLSLPDLTQDLYLLLFEKARFTHYVQGAMSDAEIEREIFQVELTNMLIGRLRRRQPENYRLVRRISGVLETVSEFRVLRQQDQQQPARYRRAVNVVYGLREWGEDKPLKDMGTFEDLIANIPMRLRDRRRAGCKGDSQVIISTQELIDLLVEIFRAIDSPAPLRVIRTLALLKLPIYDAVVASIEQVTESEDRTSSWDKMLLATQESPERINLQIEEQQLARRAAHEFLGRLDRMTRYQRQRTEKLWRILWHYYFDPEEPSQLLIAAKLNMSDSSVSDYRRKMEQEMQKILRPQCNAEHFSYFAEELSLQLRRQITNADELQKRKALKQRELTDWHRFNYAALSAYDRLPTV